MPSNHTYFQMSSFLHTDKQKTALMGRERQALFPYSVRKFHSTRISEMDSSNPGRFNPTMPALKRMDAKWKISGGERLVFIPSVGTGLFFSQNCIIHRTKDILSKHT